MNSMMNQTQKNRFKKLKKNRFKKLKKSRQMEVMMKNCGMIPADDDVVFT